MQIWLIELLKGIGRVFLHPIGYYLFFLAGILGVMRVKSERRDFHIRAYDAYFELRQLLPLGIVSGLVLSVVTVAVGITIPFAAILLIGAFTLLWSLTMNIRLMSPAYTVGAAFFTIIFASGGNWPVPLFSNAFHSINELVYPSIAVLLGLLLIVEGFLIYKNGPFGTSPKIVKSKRGQHVGVHSVRRLWMLPVFLLIPGHVLHLPFEWWPVFHLGADKYSLILVPFAIGLQQRVQGSLPKEGIQRQGKRVIALGIATSMLSIAGYWFPLISIGVVALAVISREALTLMQRTNDEALPFYFSKKNHGLMILGIIPDSVASKMMLQVGESIAKVNGVVVQNEQVFYEALQKNRAHCKLEVLDTNGEIRFVQRALYEGDHHELGILFVPDELKFEENIS